MQKAGNNRACGYSLVELLVVLGVIAVLASIAVPTLMKAGAFSSEDQSISSRLICDLLKSAQVYAGTHRTDAAVVYGVNMQKDSETAADAYVADVVVLCRRATDEEAALAFPTAGDSRRDILFVPVLSKAGTFKRLREGMCIQGDIFDQTTDFVSETEGTVNEFGLSPVLLLNEDGSLISPRPNCHYRVGTRVDMYPAHIFKPSGYVDCDTTKERYVLLVGPTPETPVVDRFIDPDSATPEPVPPDRIELFRSTGRVKVSRDDA